MVLKEPIFITGCARSGTSMTAGIIHYCGAWGGALLGPTRYNPKGQFENPPIVRGLVKPLLSSLGYDPLGQNPLPDIEHIKEYSTNPEAIIKWKIAIQRYLTSQGYDFTGVKPWFLKGAKMCLIWPIWAKAYPNAHWIIVERRDELIINSCMRTSFMRKRTTRKSWQEWIDIHKQRFAEMTYANLNPYFVDSEKIVKRDFSEIQNIVETIGLKWNKPKVEDFVDASIWGTAK